MAHHPRCLNDMVDEDLVDDDGAVRAQGKFEGGTLKVSVMAHLKRIIRHYLMVK